MDPQDEIDKKHAAMRKKDRKRIESGEATPQQVQDENAMFKFKKWKITKFT